MLFKIENSSNKIRLITLLIVIAGCIIISVFVILVTRNDPGLGPFVSTWTLNTSAVGSGDDDYHCNFDSLQTAKVYEK